MKVDKEKCIACGMCVKDCIVRDIEIVDNKAEIKNKNVITVIVTYDNAIAEKFDRVIRIVDGKVITDDHAIDGTLNGIDRLKL